MSPATESLEKIIAKFDQPWTTYYYIADNDIVVGAVRIVHKNDGSRKRISPIWIMSEFRNKGYAQQAMIELEKYMVLTIGVLIQFYKKKEICIYMRKWDMFKPEGLSI